MREIQEHKIKIYEFPETDDEEENRLVKKIKVLPPPELSLLQADCVSNADCGRVAGQAAAGCGGKQHHHRGERQEGPRPAVPLGGGRR